MRGNRIYRGEIVHKEQAYPGAHPAIIAELLWDKAQSRLAENAVERRAGTRLTSPSLLTGLIFDGAGNRMTPTHAVKNGTRYRYYVSRPLICDGKSDPAAGLRVPANEVEKIVSDRLCRLLKSPADLLSVLEPQIREPAGQEQAIVRGGELAQSWLTLRPLRLRAMLLRLLDQVEVRFDGIEIRLSAGWLAALLADRPATQTADENPAVITRIAARLCRAGKQVRMILDPADPVASPVPDPILAKTVVKAHRFHARLVQGRLRTFGDLARGEQLHRSHLSRILRLAYLAPDLTAAILDGRQPIGLTATRLIEHPDLPLSWHEQRRLLGFRDPG
jgi:hypothetical protein